MIAELAEFVGFDFVFLGLRVIHIAFAGTGTPRAFHHRFFAKKIGGLNRVGFVGAAKNHPVAEIQRQHPGFVVAQGRDKRGCRLRGGDNGRARLADHVHAVVIAGAVLAGGHKPLCLVRPEDEQVVFGAFGLRLVKSAQGVIIEEQFQERVNITALGLKFLRHCHENDFATINRGKIEGAFLGTENFSHFGREKILKVITNGFPHTTNLLGWLVIDETIDEMFSDRGTPRGFNQIPKIINLFL